MQGKYKNIIHIFILTILVILTFRVLLRDQDTDEIITILKSANVLFVMLAVMAGTSRIWGEAISIHLLMKSFGENVTFAECIGYAGVGFLFCGITPSASGGQPAQLYYMKRGRHSLANSGLCLVLVTIASRASVMLFGIVVFGLYCMNIYRNLGKVRLLFFFGFLINACLCIGFLLALFAGKAARRMAVAFIELLKRWHLLKEKQRERLLPRVMHTFDRYEKGAAYIGGHRKIVVRLVLINVLQRCVMYLVPYFVYRSFGMDGQPAAKIMLLQSIVAICADMLPLPGGVYANERCYMLLMEPVFHKVHVLPSMLLSRGISFYLLLILSAGIVLVSEMRTAANSS